MKHIILIVISFLIWATVAHAEPQANQIWGEVLYIDNSTMPGVTISIHLLLCGEEDPVCVEIQNTSPKGEYITSNLPDGTYKVSASQGNSIFKPDYVVVVIPENQ